jgi:hypothetical protein
LITFSTAHATSIVAKLDEHLIVPAVDTRADRLDPDR